MLSKAKTLIRLLKNLDRLPRLEAKIDELRGGKTAAISSGPTFEYGLTKDIVLPNANYAPWLSDPGFVPVYEEMRAFTAVDVFRCYELWRIVNQLGSLSGDLIEIGVWRGGTAMLIARAMRSASIKTKFYACDTFAGLPTAGQNDPFYRGGEFADTSLDSVTGRFDRAGLEIITVPGIFPTESQSQVRSDRLRFAHIDVDIYESAKLCFNWVWDRLEVGGVVVFDDYGFVDCAGVTRFVDLEVFGRRGCVILHNLNGHAIVVKTA